MTQLLFVYGTLRRGEPGHPELKGARFVRAACTSPHYELVDLGEYPALVEGGDTSVVGELYEVDDTTLQSLDVFEDVPDLYQRKPIIIGDAQAQCYVLPRVLALTAPRIASGDWRQR